MSSSSTAIATSTQAPQVNNGVTTSFLPITTTFSSPPECQTALFNGYSTLIVNYDPGYEDYVDQALSCLPDEAVDWWGQTTASTLVTSLGPVICPDLYTTASTSDSGAGSTFVACCPSSYTFSGTSAVGIVGECVSYVEPSSTYAYAAVNITASTYQNITTTATETVQIFGVQINGWNFAVATSTSSSSTTLATLTSTTAAAASSSSAASKATGLSGGAKAGIGVGVTLGVLALIALIAGFFLIRRRRQRARASAAAAAAAAADEGPDNATDHGTMGGEGNVAESPQEGGEISPLKQSPPVYHEMEHGHLAHEMHSPHVAHELPGTLGMDGRYEILGNDVHEKGGH